MAIVSGNPIGLLLALTYEIGGVEVPYYYYYQHQNHETIWIDVNTNVSLSVNLSPLINSGNFKSIESGIAFNEIGMDLSWNFITINGNYQQTQITPSIAGDYQWNNEGDGMYSIDIPAAGGVSINNDGVGFGWFTGICDSALAWRSPIYGFRSSALNDGLIENDGYLALESTIEELLSMMRRYCY